MVSFWQCVFCDTFEVCVSSIPEMNKIIPENLTAELQFLTFQRVTYVWQIGGRASERVRLTSAKPRKMMTLKLSHRNQPDSRTLDERTLMRRSLLPKRVPQTAFNLWKRNFSRHVTITFLPLDNHAAFKTFESPEYEMKNAYSGNIKII